MLPISHSEVVYSYTLKLRGQLFGFLLAPGLRTLRLRSILGYGMRHEADRSGSPKVSSFQLLYSVRFAQSNTYPIDVFLFPYSSSLIVWLQKPIG